MKIHEIITEAVNTRGFVAGFKRSKPILGGDYTLVATPGFLGYGAPRHGATSNNFRITALDSSGQQVGLVDFVRTADTDEHDAIFADSLEVMPSHRRRGIASEMYKFARELGNDIQPSSRQTAMGRDFWSKRDHSVTESESESLAGSNGTKIKIGNSYIDVQHTGLKYAPRSQSVIDFVVDEADRGRGVGTRLLKMAQQQFNDMGAQASSAASVKVFYNAGFRNPGLVDGTFEDHERMRQEDSSVFMAQNN